ncbi:MAG: hypothetical protein M1834_000332 [Cirrosporium novae-zelandiae]|nr:MAG: hypothetical protein M1834_000332 [Cirrosporium novae-zelandiae]
MAHKIQKTIARQQEKIAEGQYYEAHQQLRVIASRFVKQENWNAAIEILTGGAISLMKAGQGGSGGDLCLFLMDVYRKGEVKSDATSKGMDILKHKSWLRPKSHFYNNADSMLSQNTGRLLTLVRAFPPGEPTRKRFINEMVAWSGKFGEFESGDPELHHVAGTLFAEDHDPYDAERHLALGTKDSPEVFSRLEYEWYKDDDSHTAALYLARVVFPYLLVGNLHSANKSFLIFTSQLVSSNPSLSVQEVSTTSSDMRVYPSLPLLNFIGLLLLAIQRQSADVFKQLAKHYAPYIKEVGVWDDALANIGELYFGVKIPRQGNPLMDMMGSMLFGGGSKPQPKPKQVAPPAPPPPMDLD